MRSVVALSAFACAALLACAASRAAEPDGLSARVDAVVERALAEQRLVGAVVVVMRNGATVHERAYGHADRERGVRTRTDTVFRLASCTKTIVSAAALALVDDGRLRLDDPVRRWLPEFDPRLPDGAPAEITLHQLLTHTSGLSYSFMEAADGPYHRARVSTGLDAPGLPMQEELQRIGAAGLAFSPGAEWRYSVGIDVLGAVVAAAARAPLESVVDARIARPLGARSFTFTVRDRRRLAKPYYLANGSPRPMAEPQDVDFPGIGTIAFAPSRNFDARSFPSGGAGMSATAPDFARFLDAIRAGGAPLLRSASATAMLENQIGTLPTALGPGWGFGYGGAVLLDVAAAGSPQNAGTWTWSGVYGNSWFVDPRAGLTVVALTNTAPEGDSGPFTLELRNAIYGAR